MKCPKCGAKHIFQLTTTTATTDTGWIKCAECSYIFRYFFDYDRDTTTAG